MSGLFGALANSAQSLSTQSEGVQLAGKNLANLSTKGYARQRLVIGSLGTVQTPIGAQSMGTQAVGIQQIRDKYLDVQMTREISQTSLLQAQDINYLKAQADLNEQVDSASSSSSISDTSSSTTGISSSLNDFFNAFENVAASPGDPGAKQLLLGKADLLTNKINVTDSRLASLQDDITAQNKDDLDTANNLLKQVASLNGQIQKVEMNAPTSAVDLRDERQAKLEELSQYMNFTVKDIHDGNGQIQILSKDANGADVTLVDKTSVLGGMTYDDTTKTFSGGAPATALSLQGGSLKGNVIARDEVIQQLRDDIHSMADQLKTSVNQAYNPDGTGKNFFASAPVSGVIALDSTLSYTNLRTASNGDAGGNDIALAVAAVANQKYSTSAAPADGTASGVIDGTLSSFYSKVASGFGQSISGVESKLSDQQTVQSLISTQRDTVSGVSQDEELTDLMKFQRGFQASSRVINVIDNLLDIVINGLVK